MFVADYSQEAEWQVGMSYQNADYQRVQSQKGRADEAWPLGAEYGVTDPVAYGSSDDQQSLDHLRYFKMQYEF